MSGVKRFRTTILLLLAILILPFVAASGATAESPEITLASTAPVSAQAGTHVVVRVRGFPSGGVSPRNLTVQLTPASGGEQVMVSTLPMGRFGGPEQGIAFIVPKSIAVTSPTEYSVSLSGTTSGNTPFSAANALTLTINPPPSITLTSTSGQAGQTLKIDITGIYTNFSKRITAANFGPGISVGKGEPGGWGHLIVNSPTSATAIIRIGPQAATGPRTITVRTGNQDAAATFTVDDSSGDTAQNAEIDAALAEERNKADDAAPYTITDLGTLGGNTSYGHGINDSGQVTGGSKTSSGYEHAFLYSGGIMTDLGALGGNASSGYDINDYGQVTGYAFTGSDYQHAFLYSGGTITDLGTLGGNGSVALGINNSGQVTGLSSISSGVFRAFFFSGGTMTDLDTLGGDWSVGYGINNSGQITGRSNNHAFLYSGGTMTDLGTRGSSVGYGINDYGQVTGCTYTSSGDHAFLYSGGIITDLGTLGGNESSGWGINDSGQVTGYAYTVSGCHAFLYSGGTMTDLNTLLPAGSGWELNMAFAINNSGQITGSGVNSSGQSRAFILAPVWPATHFSVSAPTSATAGSDLTFTITALDDNNNIATTYAGTVRFTSSDGTATLPADVQLTNGAGAFTATLKSAGNQTITATDTTTSTATGTSNSIAVSAASANHFSVSAPAAATGGATFSITVTALDANNNTATSYSGTVHFTSSDTAAALPANAQLTNGVGAFQTTLFTTGSQTITATDTATASISGASSAITLSPPVTPVPDLTITKTHSGNFRQGQKNAIYTIKVTNIGNGPTSGTVTVRDALPTAITVASSITGSGWSCNPSSLTCTTSKVLKAKASYPPIRLEVNVAADAAATVTNTATVSGGGETDTTNNTTNDATTIIPVAPDLTITKKHLGKFRQGRTGSYTIKVTNIGNGPTSGTVTVTDTLPTGLMATSINGSGWICNIATLTCTTGKALQAKASYPPINLQVNVATDAPSSVTNTATVTGGGERNTGNNTANDVTGIY